MRRSYEMNQQHVHVASSMCRTHGPVRPPAFLARVTAGTNQTHSEPRNLPLLFREERKPAVKTNALLLRECCSVRGDKGYLDGPAMDVPRRRGC